MTCAVNEMSSFLYTIYYYIVPRNSVCDIIATGDVERVTRSKSCVIFRPFFVGKQYWEIQEMTL